VLWPCRREEELILVEKEEAKQATMGDLKKELKLPEIEKKKEVLVVTNTETEDTEDATIYSKVRNSSSKSIVLPAMTSAAFFTLAYWSNWHNERISNSVKYRSTPLVPRSVIGTNLLLGASWAACSSLFMFNEFDRARTTQTGI
jgi:hypothetical protein